MKHAAVCQNRPGKNLIESYKKKVVACPRANLIESYKAIQLWHAPGQMNLMGSYKTTIQLWHNPRGKSY